MTALKHVLPTQHIGTITVTLESYDKKTGYSLFSIEFDAFSKVQIKLTGGTLDKINDIALQMLKERKKERKNV